MHVYSDRPKTTTVWINPIGIHCNEMEILHQWNWHKNSPWFMGTSPTQQQKWHMLTIKHQNKTRHWRPAYFGRFLLSWPARWLQWMDLAPKSVEGSCDLKRTIAPPAAQLWYEHLVLDHVIRKNCTWDPQKMITETGVSIVTCFWVLAQIETSRVGDGCNSICGPKISHFAGSPKSGNRSSLSSQIHCSLTLCSENWHDVIKSTVDCPMNPLLIDC